MTADAPVTPAHSRPLRSCVHATLFWIATMAALVAVSGATHALSWVLQAVVNGAVGSAAAYALSFWFCRRDGLSMADARLTPDRKSLPLLAFGLIAGALLASAFALLLWCFGIVTYRFAATPAPAALGLSMLGFVLLALREEIVFRGYLLRTLETGLGRGPALALMATLFTVEHLLGGYSILNAVVGSVLSALVFGMAAIASRSLAFPLGLHAAWNIIDWASGGKGGVGILERAGEATRGNQLAGLSVYAGIMGIALLVLWQAERRRTRSAAS